MLVWAHIRFFAMFVKVCLIESNVERLLTRYFNVQQTVFDRIMNNVEDIDDVHKRIKYLTQAHDVAQSTMATYRLHHTLTQKIAKDADEATKIAEYLGYV